MNFASEKTLNQPIFEYFDKDKLRFQILDSSISKRSEDF